MTPGDKRKRKQKGGKRKNNILVLSDSISK